MLVLQEVLSDDELTCVIDALAEAEFQDGRATAPGAAGNVKKNLQLKRSTGDPMPLDRLIVGALSRHELMQAYALPKTFAAPLFSRYEPGMKYGAHVDSAVLTGQQVLRTDLSITLFLSDPSSYQGGELVIDSETGPKPVKLPAGQAIVYPTFALHEVKEVTQGIRLAAVTWCQSLVRDPQMRRILFDLAAVSDSLNDDCDRPAEAQLIAKSLNNLLRLVIEP